jgi:DNA-binding GntR family transcriptional regulator
MKLRESISDRVKQVLLDRILNGTYKPGDRLVELQIARELDTSQGPVREALRELEAMRVIESEPYRGTRVREISLRELRETYQLRGELEAFAARLAAPKFHQNPDSLQLALTAFQAAVQSQNLEKVVSCNTTFHRLIVETADSQVLLQVWDSLAFGTWTRINLLLTQRKKFDLGSAIKEHQVIVNALIQNDGETAGELLRQHAETVIHSFGDGEFQTFLQSPIQST